ncbi:MAG: hypothetical protein HYR60_29190 [Acidobacteria bacterium]|nr:hypothetical protein [Acidobacteriota bacterium]MBI3470523.1 hypothetical protein [Candidatus Solibacter usitatus]
MNGTPPRFVFRGHATGMSMRLTKIGDQVVNLVSPVHGDSCLPATGGHTTTVVAGSDRFFDPHFSYDECSTATHGTGDPNDPDGEFVTAVTAVVNNLRITEVPSPGEGVGENVFRVQKLSLGLQSTFPPKPVKFPTIGFTELNPYVNMSLNDLPITLELDLALMAPQVRGPITGGPQAGTIVKSVTWDGNVIPGNVLKRTGFGVIYFGETLISDYELRVTLLRFKLGSSPSGDGTGGDGSANGSPIPPR